MLGDPGRDGRRIFEGRTGSTLPVPCCEDDDVAMPCCEEDDDDDYRQHENQERITNK